jgi:ABC-type bacteriocin/lantibiotic exporter with double-glycine peptidase domain
VSFRYGADGPPILEDVSLSVEPGEFVALVGPSGSGKSTLLRLLLGFDSPSTGTVYYDGHDLASVDVSAVRGQIGVVLQSSRLMAGDVFTNIVGSAPLTMDEAWAAAEMAGVADDIRAMPMGMHTLVSDGASTLSGGQRQRLLIARALVRRPRLVFFDEATSALDNRSQEIVSRSLERTNATRLVIAHRLSTIRHADRILVIERGHVVQAGSFDALARQPGLFAQLIARQVA